MRSERPHDNIIARLTTSTVTFLSIIANNAIAVPLSASFPTPELRYIIDNSQPFVFLTSEKHNDKAQEVLQEGIENKPVFARMDKLMEGSKSVETVNLDAEANDDGGMMLYTSGTTSRPVRNGHLAVTRATR